MADLYQFQIDSEEPLDCIYILQCSDTDPLAGLEQADELRDLAGYIINRSH